MSDFLTAVRTVPLRTAAQKGKPNIVEVVSTRNEQEPKPLEIAPSITGPDDVLQLLRSQPDEGTLRGVLQYLGKSQGDGFNIKIPSPSSAQIINELVATIVPDFWASGQGVRDLLLGCLRSVAGLGAILARLKLLISSVRAKGDGEQSQDVTQPVKDLIAVLSQLLSSDTFSLSIWQTISKLAKSPVQGRLLWKEFLASAASGKIISVVAQAEDAIKSNRNVHLTSWLASGASYSTWLGRNAAVMAETVEIEDEEAWRAVSQLCGKAFSIGYSTKVVEELHNKLTLGAPEALSRMQKLASHLAVHEQRQLLEQTIKFMCQACPALQQSGIDLEILGRTPVHISGASSLLALLSKGSTSSAERLSTWLSDPALNASESFAIRRAALAAVAHYEDRVQDIMEKSMQAFGGALFIKHAPILQQEAAAQTLLMACGYVHRSQPMFLFTLARSSIHLNAISNRMNASSSRARFLGLVVGMAISELTDKPGQRMTFDLEEIRTPEAQWYLYLTRVNDTVGSPNDMKTTFLHSNDLALRSATQSKTLKSGKTQAHSTKMSGKVKASQTEVVGPKIMEVLSDSEDDDDLVPYDKPDSDPEDEDEDPTLINRNKPRAPVYIRDLMAGLHDTENYDRYTLALSNAAPLIRRKGQFGKEVSDHAVELATLLTGLGDPFELDNFQELRLQALIALLLSDPAGLAPWFARSVFDGDYSLSQRATVLSVLGLGARELAGLKDEDELNPPVTTSSFPSKKLPERLHKVYARDQAPVQLLASKLERSMIQPMALQAADNVSGPNVLKVRTFSSRMEVEKKRKKAIPNALAKVVAESFFFPLTGRWWQNMQAYGADNVHFQPLLLSTYLKTLALLLHASGTSTLSLPQMTSEFWDLLLSVRTHATSDVSIMEAVLFALLTLLEVNDDKRRIAEEHSKQLMETQEWAELVFERTAGGDEEGERVRMLAASVLLKTREVVEKFQRLLVSDMLDY